MIDLKPYVVILTVKPSARLPQNLGRIELNFPNTTGPRKVWIAKIEEESADTFVQTGIRFRVFVDSENIAEAVNSAKSFADGIASMITLLTGKGMDIPREEVAYELTPDVQKREFRQIFYDVPIKSASRRQVDPQKLTEFIDRTLKIKPPDSEHIARAIRWYRLGATVTDPFDQFNSFWIGLEALNPLLQQKFSIKDDPARCPKCKHEWIATPTVSGIRFFIQNKMKGEEYLYRDVHQLRIDIMHSTKKLSELVGPVTTFAPKTGEILFRAICFLLDFEDWNLIAHGSILREFPMRGELHALLLGNDPTALGINGQDPCFELGHNLKKTESSENGRISFKVESSFTAKINRGVQFENVQLRLYGDNETSGEITDSVFKKADVTETKSDYDTKVDFEVVNVVSGQEDWSIYKLVDETILKIRIILIKALRQNSFDSKGNPNYQLNTQTIIGIVPLKNNWGKPSPPFTQGDLQFSITHKELKFETLQEPWNKYVLSDGTKVQIRIVLTTASKTDKHDPNGEPVYTVNWVSSVESEVPEGLRKSVLN